MKVKIINSSTDVYGFLYHVPGIALSGRIIGNKKYFLASLIIYSMELDKQ